MYGLIFERQDGTKYITRENKVDVKEFNVPGPNFTTERVPWKHLTVRLTWVVF